jgi:mono/diheme cytochrome c family protein
MEWSAARRAGRASSGPTEAMKRAVVALGVASIWFAVVVSVASQAEEVPAAVPSSSPDAAPIRAALNQYCVTCHNDRLKTSGLSLQALDVARVGDHPEVWEQVVRKLRTGSMPPPPARRPDQAGYDHLISWLESSLDRAAEAHPNPGRPLMHRLNRSEYKNAIRDLLALDVDIASLLPPDDSAFGFDNIADMLGVSPVLLERYLNAAEEISALAVGDRDISAGSDSFHVRQDLSQDQHIEGLPLGTVGGTLVHYTFPLDGEYVIQAKLFRTNLNAIRGLEYAQQLEITIDGRRVHLAPVGGPADLILTSRNPTDASDVIDSRLQVRVPVKAGPRDIGVTFLQKSPAWGTVRLQPYLRSSADTFDASGRPHLQTVTVMGPYHPAGPGDTPSRRRIFVCHPTVAKGFGGPGPTSTEGSADELACARTILSRLARLAYRHELTAADLDPLMKFYQAGRHGGTFEMGIQTALQRILATPKFVFRIERDPADAVIGTPYRISDIELASRLSFFLWSSIPDDELLTLASRHELRNSKVLEQQVRRMVRDPKSSALVSNFAGQWLQVRNLRSMAPNANEFPDFDDNLRQAFQHETEMFFESIMREDRSVVDLMTADYTFVNERLAEHYGIPNVHGDQFRRVNLTDEVRWGLLGKGSILLVTSHADRTSPVVRGKWILENLLGTPPPPPPPDVPALKDDQDGSRPLTLRARMAAHRDNPVCASCHKVMDPIGFTLENFDAVGAYRLSEAGAPVDASGQWVDGTKVDGVVTLRHAIMKRPDVFVRTMTQKLLTYALGRGLEPADMPAVRAIVRDAAGHDYSFSSLVLGVVNSQPFQMRIKPLPAQNEPVVQTSRAREDH